MDDADESLANKVLHSAGLPQLPSISTNDLFDAIATAQVIHEPVEVGAVDKETQQAGQDLDLQINFSPLPIGDAIGEASSNLDDAMSFGDWSQGFFDDGTTPDWLWAGMLAPNIDISSHQPQLLPPLNLTTAQNPEESHNYDDADPDIVNQISARFGTLQLAPDGKLRYFGTPANAHVLYSNRVWSAPSSQKLPRTDSSRLLRSAELDLQVAQDFKDHLINIFFSWHNSCHPVVDEAMYWSASNQQEGNEERSGFCSEVLTNAMCVCLKWMVCRASADYFDRCAIGAGYEARYHPELVTFPRPLADFFAERSKVLLELELDSPCVATVQALLLLSSHEAGYQRIARSWLYGGKAKASPIVLRQH
jgi:hypothetical protein